MKPPYVSFAVRARRPPRVGAGDIVDSVLAALRAGHLPPGSRLPPVRVLEHQLGVGKNTVQCAYDELVARGALETREREGVFVALAADGGRLASSHGLPAACVAPLARLRPAPPVRHTGGSHGDALLMSSVFIDPALLPRDRLADCARSVLKSPGLSAFYDGQGYGPLREVIATRLRARGIEVGPSNVIVTTGSQQALDIVGRALAVRRVALEDPVYDYARLLFETLGLAVAPLPLDPFAGIALDSWEARIAAAPPGLLYAITSYQNPTGYSYTTHELARVLRLAREHRVGLLEDDWGSDMLSGSEYRPTLRALGGPGVLYANSFTKKVLPSLRVGFLVADEALVPDLVAHKRLSTLGNNWLSEAILAEFLDRGYYDTHLAALQRELDARYASCLAALDELMPEGVRWTTPGGGPTLWLELPREIDLEALRQRLAARRVVIETAASQFAGEPHLHGFRVSYAFSPPDALRRGLEALRDEISRT
ncbi:MAG TPA: PLP-dependent aminotransferase family protein [Polyangiaceae bacterium]|nr:PLP-dependent aminotransferase family protein [Polyangiaceae bacterium]